MVSVIGQGRELFSPWYLATKAFASFSARHQTPVLSGDLISARADLGRHLNRVSDSEQRLLVMRTLPKAMPLSIRGYIKLTGLEPQVLRIDLEAAPNQTAIAFAPGSG
jgi:hypothetical protein